MPAASLSVVVPFRDAPASLHACLNGLRASSAAHELIVVDDASTDGQAILLAQGCGGLYVRVDPNAGPAAARNAGARRASGDVLVFVDSDVVVRPDTLARLRAELEADPGAVAVFGSYDDAPAARGVVSEYRNLLHHHVHQTGPREASTFWAGCGAVRRAAFERAGGFDESYRRPSIEDIELGMRLKAAGGRILLRPEIQCKHLKRWKLGEMIAVDVGRRAIPWARLLLQRAGTGGDLNVSTSQKLCVVLVFALLLCAPLAALLPSLRGALPLALVLLAALGPVAWINRSLYALFLRHRGPLFLAAGFALHLLYYLYSGLAYGWARLRYR